MPTPTITPHRNTEKVSFMIPPAERVELREIARAQDLSESQLCRRAVRLVLAKARESAIENGV